MEPKLYKNADGQEFKIDGGTTGIIYPSHPNGEQTIVRIKMDGVYPVLGYSINEKCTETLVMIEGSFKVRVNGDIKEIRVGDVLMITPGTKYRVEGRGEALDIITPKWDKAQNKVISDPDFKI